ncbi:MAG: hypothetical protein JJ899_10465 [Alphaproteobacteria bacterium]|nr:hypothetical protein [Alphaproteobacteria bacterium]
MNDAPGGERADAIELRLVVWQFVRVMVQLEKVSRVRGRDRAPSVYGAWRSAWTEIDRTLERLGKTDADAFSDLMMNQEVVLKIRDRSQLNEVTRTAENVVGQLDQQIREARGNAQQEEDLQFERREMKALVRQLRKMGPASGKKRRTGGPRPSRPASPPRRGRKQKG